MILFLASALFASTGLTKLPQQASIDQIAYQLSGHPAPDWQPNLVLHEQPAKRIRIRRPVLYVHGASFPPKLAVFFRFRGDSWADSLNDAGFDVFGLDFAGYGDSDRYPEMLKGGSEGDPLGTTEVTERQIERAVDAIRSLTGAQKVAIIAHSWGSMPATKFAVDHPDRVSRLILFGPIFARAGEPVRESSRWSLVTIEQQHRRFTKDVPSIHAPVLIEDEFERWAASYLATDPTSRERSPPSVKVPSGPEADVLAARAGRLPYDPAALRVPVMVVRGEWDSSSTEADAQWFFKQLDPKLERSFVQIPEATHLMHLELGRHALYAATNRFLAARSADTGVKPTTPPRYAVLFEVVPNPARSQEYLAIASRLRDHLLKMPGFIENERYRSETGSGKLLSLSLWQGEKALVSWRSQSDHRDAQVAGRGGVMLDYHLRVGRVATVGKRSQSCGELESTGSLTKCVVIARWHGDAQLTVPSGSLPTQIEYFRGVADATNRLLLTGWSNSSSADRLMRKLSAALRSQSGEVFRVDVVRDYA